MAGQKGYFQDATEPISAKLVGGVTLNHLCWARLLGTPTKLLALEGNDQNGILIRDKLQSFDVGTDTIAVSDTYCTSVSHIFLDAKGERSIMMAPGSTSTIQADVVQELFYPHFENGNVALFSTEISQVPLNGVIAMLRLCQKFNIPSIIDVDVPPSVAVTDANLGSMNELHEALHTATVIKPTTEAAMELLGYQLSEQEISNLDTQQFMGMAKEFKSKYTEHCNFISITNGKKGAVICNDEHYVHIDPLTGIHQVDSTGAGDAFFGGLIAGVYHYGMPVNETELRRIGNIAKCTGAACVEILGALPEIDGDSNSRNRLVELDQNLKSLMDAHPIGARRQTVFETAGGIQISSGMSSILRDCEALTKMFNTEGLDEQIEDLMQRIQNASRVFVTGIGKSGLVAQRMAASLSSIGFPAEFVHGNEWMHGDIGKLKLKDKDCRNLIIGFSASGKTRELYDALRWISHERVPQDASAGYQDYRYNTDIVGVFCLHEEDVKVVRESETWMGDVVDRTVYLGSEFEELMECVPSRSIVIQEAFVNAVMTVLHEKNASYTQQAFKVNHPGGNIGKILKQNKL